MIFQFEDCKTIAEVFGFSIVYTKLLFLLLGVTMQIGIRTFDGIRNIMFLKQKASVLIHCLEFYHHFDTGLI
jgi:hypothetical protein